jgi:multidrug resistance efflux pump
MRINRLMARTLVGAGLLACLSAPIAFGADGSTSYQGITVPRNQRQMLSLKLSDVVWQVDVKPGDKITVGQVLISEDTREEEVNLKIIKLEADSEVAVKVAQAAVESAKVAVDAAVATRDSKKLEYDRQKQMGNAGTPTELEKARLDLALAEIDIVKAKKDVLRTEEDVKKAAVDVGQKKLQAERQAFTIERMKIISPVNGFVEDILVHKGEVVDPQKPAIIVVDNEVLWAEVYLPTQVAVALRQGQPVDVIYMGEKGHPKVQGKVCFIDPVVDSAADKRLVRVELDNTKDQRPAGLAVELIVPEATAKADINK